MILLSTTVYSANRGYHWSRLPDGVSEATLDRLYHLAAEERGDFPDPASVERGVVAIGDNAAVFTIRSVPGWDSEGRASEYAAFALFKPAEAAAIDFARVLENSFFNQPSRNPPPVVLYNGDGGVPAPATAAGNLLCRQEYDGLDPRAAGPLLAAYHARCDRWRFRFNENGATMKVTCAAWKIAKP